MTLNAEVKQLTDKEQNRTDCSMTCVTDFRCRNLQKGRMYQNTFNKNQTE